jgi:hypothetical protein
LAAPSLVLRASNPTSPVATTTVFTAAGGDAPPAGPTRAVTSL